MSLQVKRLQKYQRSKFEVEKNLLVQLGTGTLVSNWDKLAFFSTYNFDLQYFFQHPCLQRRKVPHLNNMIHIGLKQKVQGHDLTFEACYIGSKYPNFISYRSKLVYLFYCRCMYEFYFHHALSLNPQLFHHIQPWQKRYIPL